MPFGTCVPYIAASYAVVLALEVTRPFFRSGVRGAAMLVFALGGLAGHTLVLGHRATDGAGNTLSSPQAWCLVAAWVVMMVYLYLVYYYPKTTFGVFLLPLVLGLMAVGTWIASPEPLARESASKVWGAVHSASILGATVTILLGFATGLMYLRQASRLKRNIPPGSGLRLPSLEWLQRTNCRALSLAMLTLGVGMLSGVVLNSIDSDTSQARLSWRDPFVLVTLVMFVWLLVANLVGLVYKPAREGHRVAMLTVGSFLVLAAALGFGLLVDTEHGRERPEEGDNVRTVREITVPIGWLGLRCEFSSNEPPAKSPKGSLREQTGGSLLESSHLNPSHPLPTVGTVISRTVLNLSLRERKFPLAEREVYSGESLP